MFGIDRPALWYTSFDDKESSHDYDCRRISQPLPIAVFSHYEQVSLTEHSMFRNDPIINNSPSVTYIYARTDTLVQISLKSRY